MKKSRILVVGSANMDLSMNMYKVPAKGETILDDGGVAYIPGGKGANAAVALQKLGADCVFCAKVGADLHGQKLYQYYKEMGIDTTYIKVDRENPTGLAVVMKESDGANRIVVYPGANSYLTVDNVTEAFECEPDALYIGFEIPFAVAAHAAKLASSRGIPVFVDAAPADKDHPLETLPPVEIFSPNESETEIYTGILPKGSDSSLRAALNLYKRVKCRYLVIKQGDRGSFVYDGRHYFFVPAMRAGKAVDTTAAGDAYTAAMVLAYLEFASDIKMATKYGTAAGAIAVTRKGASSSIPSAYEVAELVTNGDII
ncbi:MAG: ribokinase [Clostridia bacterium]|nr:ribokinase [Clostridia bacterium]